LNVTHSLRNLQVYDSVLVLVAGQLAYHAPPEFLTHYFQIETPEDLYPQLELRKPEEWHRSWKKHRNAYYSEEILRQMAAETPEEHRAHFFQKLHEAEAMASETQEPHKEVSTPGAVSQFFTLLARRWRLFFRDPSAIWLQLALVLGFPCLVVIFALDGLPTIQNLSMQISKNVLEQVKETASFSQSMTHAGSLVSGLVMFQVILLTLMGSNNGAREIAGERLIFEKEKFGGVRPSAYVASKACFLMVLVLVQSLWMGAFVNIVCRFHGEPIGQFLVLVLANAAMTFICLAISSLARSAEQASLISIYFVGFQLPLSGAVLALPKALGWITRPFIAAYWGWSGFLQTLKDTRSYDAVLAVTQTSLSPQLLCIWVLAAHVILGMFLSVTGAKNSRWE
jgi:hypothetical protein